PSTLHSFPTRRSSDLIPLDERPAYGINLVSSKVGMHAWSYSNDYSSAPRTKMTHAELTKRFSKLSVEVELGFTPEQTVAEVERRSEEHTSELQSRSDL